MKHNNSHMMGIPEGEENEQGTKNLFQEIVTEYFLNLVEDKGTEVQEVLRVPTRGTQRGPHQDTS